MDKFIKEVNINIKPNGYCWSEQREYIVSSLYSLIDLLEATENKVEIVDSLDENSRIHYEVKY